MVSKDRVKMYGYYKNVSFPNEDGFLRQGNGILWNVLSRPTSVNELLAKGDYVLTPARFIKPINNWGASEDFPALKNAIDRCAVTLCWLRTNQKKLSGQGKESALAF
ncbi:hypothetical protein TNCV_326561 [Trichonephila clavipes]|nr:hypothetical protein TNCV_326561 [Trichonephila clavipes]